MTHDELCAEQRRLEVARGGEGIDPDDWYRLHAVKALIMRHEMEMENVLRLAPSPSPSR
ncbi:MAG: hypothetical protein AAB853_04085 [Patescibacteria group bacterium]